LRDLSGRVPPVENRRRVITVPGQKHGSPGEPIRLPSLSAAKGIQDNGRNGIRGAEAISPALHCAT
jgi:hypothetical protein